MANASSNIPAPVIAQPISNADGLATAAIFCGRLKTPAPSIELKTSAVRALSPSFFSMVIPWYKRSMENNYCGKAHKNGESH